VAANLLEEKRNSYLDALVSLGALVSTGRSRPCSSPRGAAATPPFCVGNNGKNLFGRNGINKPLIWKNRAE
jgi:hypothetical protein